MKLVIMILIFNNMIVIFVEFAPTTIHESKFAYVESNKISMIMHQNYFWPNKFDMQAQEQGHLSSKNLQWIKH